MELISFICRLPLRAKISVGIIFVYSLVAVFGEISAAYYSFVDKEPEYNRVDLSCRYLPPLSKRILESGEKRFFLLGSDNLGRDVFRRIIQGARIAFHVGVITSLLAVPFGALLGLLAGYFGRWVDAICTWLATTIAAIPALLLILAISLVVGKGLLGIYVGISITPWGGFYRTVRAETMKHRNLGYVKAAQSLGYSTPRILFRHILPNVMHILIIAFSIRFPGAVGTEMFMSFLGIGIQNEPSWGVMINNARLRLWQGMWWEGVFVSLAVFFLVLSFNMLGDVLREKLDPTTRGKNRAV